MNADREVVYPAYIFGGTALLLALTAVHLLRINRIKQFAALYHNNGPRTSKTDQQNNHKNESISDIILFAPEITV